MLAKGPVFQSFSVPAQRLRAQCTQAPDVWTQEAFNLGSSCEARCRPQTGLGVLSLSFGEVRSWGHGTVPGSFETFISRCMAYKELQMWAPSPEPAEAERNPDIGRPEMVLGDRKGPGRGKKLKGGKCR